MSSSIFKNALIVERSTKNISTQNILRNYNIWFNDNCGNNLDKIMVFYDTSVNLLDNTIKSLGMETFTQSKAPFGYIKMMINSKIGITVEIVDFKFTTMEKFESILPIFWDYLISTIISIGINDIDNSKFILYWSPHILQDSNYIALTKKYGLLSNSLEKSHQFTTREVCTRQPTPTMAEPITYSSSPNYINMFNPNQTGTGCCMNSKYATPAATLPNILGTTPAATVPSMFGTKPAATVPNMFGTATVPSMFGTKPVATVPSMFGTTPAATMPSMFGTTPVATVPSMFGTTPVATVPSMFGTTPVATVPSMFSQSTGFGVQSTGFGVQSTGFGVKSTGFGVKSTGFGVKSVK